jgi:hypothetical protein
MYSSPDRNLDHYVHGGARALVLLHENALREFVAIWREARAAVIEPPPVDDPNYASLEAVLRHVLRAARGYMRWACKTLELPDPEIRSPPEVGSVEAELDDYVQHLCERWALPFASVAPEAFDRAAANAAWGPSYVVDSMMEHAVMHPIRHGFQLRSWLDA